MLDEAKRSHPDAWWWIKADGCDLTVGLAESVSHVWSGDEDMCDGKLQRLYTEYTNRRQFATGIGLDGRQGMWDISTDLITCQQQLEDDLLFVSSGWYQMSIFVRLLSQSCYLVLNRTCGCK